MKLMTKDLEKKFAKVGSQRECDDPTVVAKFFDPCGRWTYFATEFYPEDRTIFGYCVSPLGDDCDEWGYASLDEIEATKNGLGLGMERDLYFDPKKASEVKQIH
jgi:hypothetical protein